VIDADQDDPAVAARPGGHTYHLTPEPVWRAQEQQQAYQPEAFEVDGFIHCTDGEVNLLAVANAFYQADQRPYVVLVLDRDRINAPVRFEDADRIFPHIYGALNRDAVVDVRRAIRLADGSFVSITSGATLFGA